MNRCAIFISAKYSHLVLLVIFIVWIGLQPRFFLDRMSPTLNNLNSGVRQAAEALDKAGPTENGQSCQLSVISYQ